MTEQPVDPVRRTLVTVSTMLAAVLVTLDVTIANVALPRIQSSVGASPEQIIWVVTSYVIAAAIATPLSGWLASRYGRKEVMVSTIAAFTVASVACGLATDLYSLVLFRFLQGATGAAIVPLSQATLLDIYPTEKHGQAMAIFGIGSMVGSIIGPALGGWLTEWMTWRAVFLINVPFGTLAAVGMFVFMSPVPKSTDARFDFFGFITLSIFLASLQLMVDRGQQLDWFDSPEIWAEATIMAVFGYIFLVHVFTSRSPFISPGLFKDRNFSVGSIVAVMLGVLVFSSLPLIGIMLQQLLGYPVLLAGLVQAPRGIATAITMVVAGALVGKVDTRILIFFGLAATGVGYLMMAGFSLETGERDIILAGIVMSIGSGLIFVPLSALVFSTLDPKLRNEGAATFTLVRNIGQAVGISLLQVMTLRNGATVQARLSEGVRPDSPLFGLHLPEFDFFSQESMMGMYHEAARQAMMVAYVDSFWALYVLAVVLVPLVFLMQPAKRKAVG